ncbi:MAG: cysteine desulfurase (tRNA sulfurtransferase), PLP-dependent [Candidatus Thorarchaeota archaeon]|nr:MAG: cysteine desulfurase (tRNA sulfurtransferase), PLP-dependent [Candidatus Thorarchaeota archaeon]
MMDEVYLDYQSAKPVDPRVLELMRPYFTKHYGNPSALHSIGDRATEVLEKSREKISRFINADPGEIIFTSGATESNNMALIGYALRNKRKGNHIIISEIEHISIRNIAKYLEREGFKVTRVPVNLYGRLDIKKLERRITPETILISVGYANNEIGTIQSVSKIGKLAEERGIAFHTDAVAAEGLIPIDVKRDHIHLMSLSSNDLYGPKGVGVLYMKKKYRVNPLIIGGGQERGLRSGSENMPGIVGMGYAAEITQKEMKKESEKLEKYRDRLIKELLEIPDSYLNGHPTKRLPNNAHVRFEGLEGEALLLSFKDKGIAVSTGSACTSKTLEPSHTLIATGLTHEEAHGSLQLTPGRFTQDEDIDRILDATPEIVQRLREMSPIYKPKEKMISK